MKTEICIYQITANPAGHRFLFRDYEEVMRCTGGIIPADIYKKVFRGPVDAVSLEDVYIIFNTSHPLGYEGRSLSVSDVVEVIRKDCSRFYYCDTFGFREIKFDKSQICESGADYE